MADQEMVKDLVRGAWDMHIHSGPDVMPRKFDDIELAQHAMEVGMAGFVMKSHFVGTADRATLIRRMFPQVQAYGGLALNNAIGGLNPIAVDVAGRLGTKVIWLPTTDAANEQANIAGQKDESKLPYWMNIVREMRASGIKSEPITVLDENGEVTEPTRQCLEIIARYDMILATGHVSPQEMVPVVRAAREAKVQRIVSASSSPTPSSPPPSSPWTSSGTSRSTTSSSSMVSLLHPALHRQGRVGDRIRQHPPPRDRTLHHHPEYRLGTEYGPLRRGGAGHLHWSAARRRVHPLRA